MPGFLRAAAKALPGLLALVGGRYPRDDCCYDRCDKADNNHYRVRGKNRAEGFEAGRCRLKAGCESWQAANDLADARGNDTESDTAFDQLCGKLLLLGRKAFCPLAERFQRPCRVLDNGRELLADVGTCDGDILECALHLVGCCGRFVLKAVHEAGGIVHGAAKVAQVYTPRFGGVDERCCRLASEQVERLRRGFGLLGRVLQILNQSAEHIAHIGSLFGAVRGGLLQSGKHAVDRNARRFEVSHQGNRILQAQTHLAECGTVGVDPAREGIDANAGGGGYAGNVIEQVSRLALVDVPRLHGHRHVLDGLGNVRIGHLREFQELCRNIVQLVTCHPKVSVHIADGLSDGVEVSRCLGCNALNATADFLGSVTDRASALNGDVLAFLKLCEGTVGCGGNAAENGSRLGSDAADLIASALELVGVILDGLPKLVKLSLGRFGFCRDFPDLPAIALQVLLAGHDGAL